MQNSPEALIQDSPPHVESVIPPALLEAFTAVWRLSPDDDTTIAEPYFEHLSKTCLDLYPDAGGLAPLNFALNNALRALGLPRWLDPDDTHLSLPVAAAAAELDAAFRQTESLCRYICPLDLADQIPDIDFGPNRIQKYSAEELEQLFDIVRLRRSYPGLRFEAERFARFRWLVVEEKKAITRKPSERAWPILTMSSKDLAQIEPHKGKFSVAVETALLAILIAPWEEWVIMRDADWRGFRVPWTFTLEYDIFVEMSLLLPTPDSLSWEPDIDAINDKGLIEHYMPERLPMLRSAPVSDWLNEATWSELMRALKTPAFETPVAHFFVHAFLADAIDEILAHITTIEAALGLKTDYQKAGQKSSGKKLNMGATARVAIRVAGLLGRKCDGDDYRKLFDIRSEFLHGRKMNAISSDDRLLARRLARRVVAALVKDASVFDVIGSRERYLDGLFQKGLSIISPGDVT
jgi:hypothetical protein